MDKDVLVRVRGLILGEPGSGSDQIEIIAPGEYYQKDGRHYVLYEECSEEFEEPIRNLLKISPDRVSIRKRGLINTDMVFEKGGERQSHYTTPFGSVVLGIQARDLTVREAPEEIRVRVDYSLELNYEHISDCTVQIQVQSRHDGSFVIGTAGED